jgi:hypothetical protein
MGSSGLMVFHPLKGTWNYSIKNRGTAADNGDHFYNLYMGKCGKHCTYDEQVR